MLLERIVVLEQWSSHTERRVDGTDQRDRRGSKFANFERELSLIKTQVELLRTSRSGLMGTSSLYVTDVTTTGLCLSLEFPVYSNLRP